MTTVGKNGPQNYATPPELFAGLSEHWRFRLDVCAEPWSAKCKTYYTEAEDGLEQLWYTQGAYAFCNPPFKQIRKWIQKAMYEKYERRNSSLLLVPASVGTNWFHDLAKPNAEIFLMKGRTQFYLPEGQKTKPMGSCMLLDFNAEGGFVGVADTAFCGKTGKRIDCRISEAFRGD